MARTPGSDRSSSRRPGDLYLAAALLPLVPGAASIVAAIEPGGWSDLTPAIVRGATPDALLYTAACVVVAAPLAGVAVASGRRHPASGRRRQPALDTARRLAIATAILCAASAALTVARVGFGADTLRVVGMSHAVLASATLAFAALGALLGTLFADPLDAAALAVAAALTAAFGVLVAGAPVGEMSPAALKVALLASPVMTVATAAQVDLVRSDIWYQISPLAHVRLEYPAFGTVCGSYLVAGGAELIAMTWWGAGRRLERGQGL